MVVIGDWWWLVVGHTQRFMRKWLRISKFRNTALNFLTAPESERLRKRNMAFREIVCTERVPPAAASTTLLCAREKSKRVHVHVRM